MTQDFLFAYGYAAPWLIGGIIGFILITWGLVRLEQAHRERIHRFIDMRLSSRLVVGGHARFRKPIFWFTLLGFICLMLALAQPRWGVERIHQTKRSHDLLFVLDVSESMLAEVPEPNRLERAKQKIDSIVARNPGDRYGLIAFSGEAELMCPLTLDQSYFRTVLNAVDTDSISLEGTNISVALQRAKDVYIDQLNLTGDSVSQSQAVILVSDGEQLDGNGIDTAKALSDMARVHVIGVGDPHGTEITFKSRFGNRTNVDQQAQNQLSKLDEDTLSRIALKGGGGYIRSTSSNRDVDQMNKLIQEMFTRDTQGELTESLVNRYQWPLALAIGLFLAEGFWLVLLPYLRKEPNPESVDLPESKEASSA
jgi:Ca-activated chloride channel homolog